MKKGLLILAFASAAFAQFSGSTGTTAHPLLKIGFGPRAAAMGNAYMGIATDVTALWWNPAGLNQLNTYEALVSHHEWLKGIRDEFAAVVWPQSPKNTFGFAVNFSSTSGIEHWDENNYPVSGDSLVMAYEAFFLASYTRQLGSTLGVGASLKGLYENLYDASGFGGAVDLSVHWKPSPMFGMGLSLQNIGPGMFYDGSSYMLPIQAQLGAALTFDNILSGTNFLLDVRVPMDNNISVHVGAEVWPMEMLAVRVGFQSGPQTIDQLNILSALTTGVGLVLNNYRVDYALAPYGQLGLTHRLAFIAAFGERPRYGDVIVKVIDAETKEPITAHLNIEGLVRVEKDTDEKGLWERKGLNPGKLTAKASKDDYYPSTGETQIKAGQKVELVVALSKIPPGTVAGRVFDVKTNAPLKGTITYKGPNNIQGEVPTDDNGNYTIPSLYRGTYQIHAQPEHSKYFPQDAEVAVEPSKNTQKDFALLREKELIVFHNINFETGEARVIPDFYEVLDQIGQILVDNPSIQVELAGHTDARPIKTADFNSNLDLSQARVDSVRQYLIDKFHITPERLVAKGYGEAQPLASNETEEGMAKNRRVEFKVLTGIEYYHEIKNIEEGR